MTLPAFLALPLLLLLPAACNEGSGGEASGAGQEAPTADTVQPVDLSDVGHDMGRFDARVRVIEFSDFGCVHCQAFHRETFPTIYEEFIATGDVGWKYIPITVAGFPNSAEVSEAAECAGEQREFFTLSGRLYEDPDAWREAEDPYEVAARWAEEEGLDMDRFRACLDDGRKADVVQENTRTAVQLGLQATPTFVINGIPLQGAAPVDTFREILQDQLEGRGPSPGGGAGGDR